MSSFIRVLAVGDIMGRPGRQCLSRFLPKIKAAYQPQLIVVNGENLAGGFGITEKILRQLTMEQGIQVVTTGNHWQDKKEIYDFGGRYPQLLLPANMYNVKDPRRGYYLGHTVDGHPYAVINLTGRLFMKGDNTCPFRCIDELLAEIPPEVKVRIVDFHGEATSEKQAFAHYVTGRVSLVYGTHTHCPTADERILAGTTGFQTDVGMTGAYDSVIGVRTEDSLAYFLRGEKPKFQPSRLDPWLCALVADIELTSGHCLRIERLKIDEHKGAPQAAL